MNETGGTLVRDNDGVTTLGSADLVPGVVRTVDVAGADSVVHEFVIWRGRDGLILSAPRVCPHLDHDLGAGFVSGNELVCPGHAWAFDGEGRAYKRNEFGRIDPKGTVPVLAVHEADGIIRLRLEPEAHLEPEGQE